MCSSARWSAWVATPSRPRSARFAEALQKSTAFTAVPLENTARIKPLVMDLPDVGSTDVGDVSWVVPTVQLSAATWVPGTAAHSWQGRGGRRHEHRRQGHDDRGEDDGADGAQTCFSSPATIVAARAELERRRGPNFRYTTALGTQKPQLDYRKGSVP